MPFILRIVLYKHWIFDIWIFAATVSIPIRPNEMVYFNSIGKKYASQFDRDYWHLSELQAWKYISHIDNNATITVNTSGFQFFANILSENEKKRIQIAEDPMYYIETYRGITGNEIELEGYDEIYSIIVDNFKVATIFKKK